IEGNTSADVKMMDVNEEMQLQMAVGQAFASGDTAALLQATAQMMEFKNRHITQVSEERDEYKAELDTINGKDLISLTTVGLDYLGGISSPKIRRFLQEQGVLRTVKTDGHYVPTVKYAKYFKLSTAIKNDRICKTMKVTREGASFVAKLYKRHNNKKSA
ncbi:phage antirepressor KilAC domain-containing protein, partial [Bacillus sp. JJ864]|uniref:phage antirepressor KilAC domain-containing protein n=1 Tax=Bacillus sp. JJ864 TaxID=3122975 RepID=UPI002FFF8E95